MMIFVAGPAGVDRDLYEAAAIDGAKAWQRLKFVTLPALRPVTTIALTLGTIRGLRVFTEIYVLTDGGPAGSTQTVVPYDYLQATTDNDIGYAAAIPTLLLAFTILATVLVLRWRRRAQDWDGHRRILGHRPRTGPAAPGPALARRPPPGAPGPAPARIRRRAGVFLLPLWSMLATALSDAQAELGRTFLLPSGLTGRNLSTAWSYGVGRGLLNSAVMEAVGLSLQLTVSSLAAYAPARERFRGAAAVMTVIMATMMMPDEVIAIPLFLIIGKIPEPFTHGTLLDSYGGLILPPVGWALPIYILTGFMKRIPAGLEEAARVDGAGDLRIFLRIVPPLGKPALGTCAVFGFLMIWDQYLLPLLVVQAPSMDPLTVVVTSLQSSEELPDGVRLAAAAILMIPSVLFYPGLQRVFERGLFSGSVKG